MPQTIFVAHLALFFSMLERPNKLLPSLAMLALAGKESRVGT